MEKEEIVLRKSRRRLMVNAVITGLVAVGCFISAFTVWEGKDGQWFMVIGGVLPLAGFVYFIKELRDRKIEIVIATAGIRLRGEGYYDWSAIEKISTDVDEGDVTLILYVRNKAAIRFGITSLEINDDELIELILAYGQSASVSYKK